MSEIQRQSFEAKKTITKWKNGLRYSRRRNVNLNDTLDSNYFRAFMFIKCKKIPKFFNVKPYSITVTQSVMHIR